MMPIRSGTSWVEPSCTSSTSRARSRAIRHTRSLLVTAAVDGLQFLHPIKVGDLIILEARVTAVWSTSLEVEVEVFSEETLTGERRLTSRAYLTFVTIDRDGHRSRIPGLILETERRASARRGSRNQARAAPRSASRAGASLAAASACHESSVTKSFTGGREEGRNFLFLRPACAARAPAESGRWNEWAGVRSRTRH